MKETPNAEPPSAILEAREEMVTSRALRSDSKMANLSPDHFEQVVQWLLDVMPVKTVVELCEKELHLPKAKVPSVTALYTFLQLFGPYYLRARRRIAGHQAALAYSEATNSPVQWDRVNADAIKQHLFELLSNPNFDPKTAKTFVMASLKIRDQDLAARKLAVLEQRIADAKEVISKAAAKGGLTPETQKEIEQSLSLL